MTLTTDGLKALIEKMESDLSCLKGTLAILEGQSFAGLNVPVAPVRAHALPAHGTAEPVRAHAPSGVKSEPPAGKAEPRAAAGTAVGSQKGRILKALIDGPKSTEELAARTGIKSTSISVAIADFRDLVVKSGGPGTRSPWQLTPAGLEAARHL